jgi:hypothetical protein
MCSFQHEVYDRRIPPHLFVPLMRVGFIRSFVVEEVSGINGKSVSHLFSTDDSLILMKASTHNTTSLQWISVVLILAGW